MAIAHDHQVSNDARALAVNDHSKIKRKISSKNDVIELKDDDDNDDCNFLLREKKPSIPKGTNKQDSICVEEYSVNRNPKIANKMLPIDIDSVQCVDDYDDNDEVRIVIVRPSSRSFIIPKKRKKPFGSPSVTEVGECSGSKLRQNVETVQVVDSVALMFTCEICADCKPQSETFMIKGCSHSYCRDCIKNYVASKLQDCVCRINCPVPGCRGVLEPEYCREILPFEVFARWGNQLCESVILASQKFYCPFKDCSALLINDGGEVVTRSECPSCFRTFCAQCKVGWHEGIECAEYQKLSKDEREKEDIMLRNLAKNQKWQRCPRCKFYVEKSVGCLYMKCRCGVAFCYNCGAMHTDHTYHYCKRCAR